MTTDEPVEAWLARKVERLKRSNPMNGDGSNYALEQVLTLLVNCGGDVVQAAANDERAKILQEQDDLARRIAAENRERTP